MLLLVVVVFCCFFLRRRRKKTPRTTAARRATPPTTPPAMAPTGVDFLVSLASAKGGRASGISEDPGEAERETGVNDENRGVFVDRPVFGEVEESLKYIVSRRVVGNMKRFAYHHQV